MLATTDALGCKARASATPAPSAPADPWHEVRAQFDLAPDWIHLGGFLLASHPRPVREAIERHRHALDDDPARSLRHARVNGPADVEAALRAVRALA